MIRLWPALLLAADSCQQLATRIIWFSSELCGGVTPVRILVVSPPRSGNHWIECLLGTIYQLRSKGGSKKPEATTTRAVRAWAQSGGFQDGWILHMHRGFSATFCDVIDAIPAHLVTVVRDPYDAFVSRYYWTQQRAPADRERAARRPRQRMLGKPLDDPEVLAFLADPKGFGSHFTAANAWLHSGRAIAVRYEELHHCPVAALTRVTDQIARWSRDGSRQRSRRPAPRPCDRNPR